ncbi:MAG: MFS transporter [Patescibacteria group bacterium]|jgi:MFS family permease
MKTSEKVPKNVFILGLVSFFNDMASEMVYPIVPIFLTTILKVSIPVVGLIEGIAEATAAIGKFIFGYLSDKIGQRKPFVISGYSFSTISKVIIGLANFWPMVLAARFIDRLGKGIRTGARDSLLLQNTTKNNKGFIFGYHRAFDSVGAVFGPIIGLILIYFFKENLRFVFYFAAIPGVIGVLLLIFFVKEKKAKIPFLRQSPGAPMGVWRSKKTVSSFLNNFSLIWKNKKLSLFFIASIIFSLGNSSDAFLILRAKNLGLTTLLAVLTYVVYNISQTLLSTPLGKLSDKIGAKKVFEGGLLVFAFVYFFFGFIKNPTFVWLLFPIYGVYIAATDGVSKAYVSEFITEKESGSYFGLYQSTTAISAFLASWIAGILWYKISPATTFYYGAIMALLAFFILKFGRLLRENS